MNRAALKKMKEEYGPSVLFASAIALVLASVLWYASTTTDKKEFIPARNVFLPATTTTQIKIATTTPETEMAGDIIFTEDGFDPAVTRVKPGGSVTFINHSNKTLELISDTLDAMSIPKGKERSVTLNEIGTLSVSDIKHPEMIGIILVQ